MPARNKRKAAESRPVSVASDSEVEERAEVDAINAAAVAARVPDGFGSLEAELDTTSSKPARYYPKIQYTMNMFTLSEIISAGEKQMFEFCQQYGLILSSRTCPECQRDCWMDSKGTGYGKKRWRCRRLAQSEPNPHDFKESVTRNTVFEGSHLSISQLLRFFYCFAHGIVSYNDLRRETSNYSVAAALANDDSSLTRGTSQTAPQTIADWISFCREIMFVDLEDNKLGNTRIGGPGITVEVDETKVGRRKHNKGRFFTLNESTFLLNSR